MDEKIDLLYGEGRRQKRGGGTKYMIQTVDEESPYTWSVLACPSGGQASDGGFFTYTLNIQIMQGRKEGTMTILLAYTKSLSSLAGTRPYKFR